MSDEYKRSEYVPQFTYIPCKPKMWAVAAGGDIWLYCQEHGKIKNLGKEPTPEEAHYQCIVHGMKIKNNPPLKKPS